MVRLTRKNIKVFAENAANNGVFGSLQAGNPVTTTNVEQVQSLPAWSAGWNSATMTSEKLPPLEEFQGIQYVTTYQQAYIMQEGIPEWASTVTYYKGSLAKEVTANGFRLYNSLTDNNENNLLSDTSNWKKVMDSEDVYAFDSDVVHIAGAETITGAKTFTQDVVMQKSVTKGTVPANNVYYDIKFVDSNNEVMGIVETRVGDNGDVYTAIGACKNESGSSAAEVITVHYPTNGNPYTSAPTPTDTTTTNGTQIATTGWVNSVGNNVMHLTGDETITGNKTLQNSMLIFKTTSTAYNETPSYNQYAGYSWKDRNGAEISAIYSAIYSNGGGLSGFNLTNKSGNSEIICLRYDSNGNFYTEAPASDVANSIVTTINKSKASKGYYQLGNGLIVQWGTSDTSNSSGVFTLPKAFTSTNYAVVINSVLASVPSSQGSNSNVVGWGVVQSRTTTNFTAFLCNYENSYWWRDATKTVSWIAIGY